MLWVKFFLLNNYKTGGFLPLEMKWKTKLTLVSPLHGNEEKLVWSIIDQTPQSKTTTYQIKMRNKYITLNINN